MELVELDMVTEVAVGPVTSSELAKEPGSWVASLSLQAWVVTRLEKEAAVAKGELRAVVETTEFDRGAVIKPKDGVGLVARPATALRRVRGGASVWVATMLKKEAAVVEPTSPVVVSKDGVVQAAQGETAVKRQAAAKSGTEMTGSRGKAAVLAAAAGTGRCASRRHSAQPSIRPSG